MIEMLVPDAYVFGGSWGATRKWIILHKTAGMHTAQDVAAYFQSGSNGLEVSSHYVIGLDGTVVQCVRETDGAGANGVLEAGCDPWWTGNPNLVTFSIEHVDPSTDNSTPMPEAQKQASFQLIHDICTRWNIAMQPADASGGITGHYSIDPQSRSRCPGNYAWDELWNYLQKGQTTMSGTPQGWSDNGTELVSPNGHKVVRGFRGHVLNNNWNPGNWALEEEIALPHVEIASNSGQGTRQLFRETMLVWYADRGVWEAWIGAELLAAYTLITACKNLINSLQNQVAQIPVPVDQAAFNQAKALVIDLQHRIAQIKEIVQ